MGKPGDKEFNKTYIRVMLLNNNKKSKHTSVNISGVMDIRIPK